MGLDKQEDELLEKLEEKGLERKIRHIQFDEPRNFEYDGKEYNNTIGITVVALVDDETTTETKQQLINLLNSAKSQKKMYKEDLGKFLMGFKTNDQSKTRFLAPERFNLKGFGVAICSAREPEYHKQLGRIIATGRAMKESNLK